MDNQITIVDLARIRTMIETACERGAFRASEMSTVGEVYERLSAFLSSVTEQAQHQQNQGESQ